jgi:hypothetical protein
VRTLGRFAIGAVSLALVALVGLAAFELLRSDVEAAVYRMRLEELQGDFDQLRSQYDQAVRRTAVTELRVEEGRLSVVIRDATGRERRIDTPFDPSREIYVDFAILDGRLWIRRVFDAETPPARGLVIDPGLADVDWSEDPEAYGKATYRSLDEGRWIVDVSGDGALALGRADEERPVRLAPPPPVRRYEPVGDAVEERLGTIRPSEALRALAAHLREG